VDFLIWGPRSVGGVTERLIYYLVSCRYDSMNENKVEPRYP